MRELDEKELEQVSGGKLTTVKENPGGQEPQGEAKGKAIDTFVENPAGKRPPGAQP